MQTPPFQRRWLSAAALGAALALSAQAASASTNLPADPATSAAAPINVATCSLFGFPHAYKDVQAVYLAFYLRPGDPAGLRYWAEKAGKDIASILADFGNSEEAKRLYGEITPTTVGDAIDKIYQALFGKAPDAAGKQYYIDGYREGRFSAADLAYRILKGAQNDDKRAINNKLAAANFFVRTVDTDMDGKDLQVTYDQQDEAVVREWMRQITATSVPTPEQLREFMRSKVAAPGDAFSQVVFRPQVDKLFPPGVYVGRAATFTVKGQHLPSTARLSIGKAQCEPPRYVRCDGSEFRQSCILSGNEGARAVTVQTAEGGAGIGAALSVQVSSGTPGAAVGINKITHTGITAQQCDKKDGNDLVACNSAEAIALSGAGKQDGMRAHINTMSYSEVPKPGGGFYKRTECVQEKVTGLMWEGKTADGGLRDGKHRYTNLGDESAGDASKYVKEVNAQGLCGHHDWRLPTAKELFSLVDFSKKHPNLRIDEQWFPNMPGMPGAAFWSQTLVARDSSSGYRIYFGNPPSLYFFSLLNKSSTNDQHAVRLVRFSR